ncbi:MlaD family protein [Nocardia vinacea]|uniref:MlaD family protein n=1 Tax=Nocardia vinacea TaxID=96468 RepID=UPI0033FE8EA5
MNYRGSLLVLIAFLISSALLSWSVAVTLERGISGETTRYSALFTNVSGLRVGDDVRMAGVRVGRVESVELAGTLARVGFRIHSDQVLTGNTPTMVQLLGNLATVAQMSYVHVPAINNLFFPTHRPGSAADALSTAFHDGAVWAIASIYPRKQCDYNLPRLPITVANHPEPYLYAYCTDPDPTLVPRGARNAPRPPGDDTAHPPAGVDPLATADPTPQGPLSIPTPYGGAPVPAYVPPK